MIQETTKSQRAQRSRLFALLVPALLYSLAITPAESLPADAPVASAITFDTLSWNSSRIAELKTKLPTYLRNRKIKHYALAAAIIGGTVGYIWYASHQKIDVTLPKTPQPEMTPDNFNKLWTAVQQLQPLQTESCFHVKVGRWNVPYCPKPEAVAQFVKATATWTLANVAVQKAANIFKFREDMSWFYNEERAIPSYAKELEAFALNLDACLATQPQAPEACVAVKKQLLVDAADLYLDHLMALYAFMEHRAQQIVAPFDAEIKEKLLPRFNNLTTSIAQVGMQLCEKLNSIATNSTRGGIPSTETARTAVMQAQNLVHALVMSFGRLEEAYAQ